MTAPEPLSSGFEPETQPAVYQDSISGPDTISDTLDTSTHPAITTESGTEAAQRAGVLPSEHLAGSSAIADEDVADLDSRTDLEGPDVLPEDDGTVTHPSFGGGVPLNLGMGTGAGDDSSGAIAGEDPSDSR